MLIMVIFCYGDAGCFNAEIEEFLMFLERYLVVLMRFAGINNLLLCWCLIGVGWLIFWNMKLL
jgi:hypothetical protein